MKDFYSNRRYMGRILDQYGRKYLEGVDEASVRGRIAYFQAEYQYGVEDRESHLPLSQDAPRRNISALNKQNSRFFDSEAEEIVKIIWKRIRESGLRWPRSLQVLISGAGAGVSAAHLSRIASDGDIPMGIDTLALSPVNPYLRFLGPKNEAKCLTDEIGDKVKAILEANSSDQLVHEILAETAMLTERAGRDADKTDLNDKMISIQAILAMQERFGLQVFEDVKDPYIRKQHVGIYPDSVDLGSKKYDLIYDHWGPVVYGSPEVRPGKHMLGSMKRHINKRAGVIFMPETKVGLSEEYFDLLTKEFHLMVNDKRSIDRRDACTIVAGNPDLRNDLAKFFGIDFDRRKRELLAYLEEQVKRWDT